MALQPKEVFSLKDQQAHDFGRIVINRIEGDLVVGSFDAGHDFPTVAHLFEEYVDAANEQLLSVVGDLDAIIAKLGLRLEGRNRADLPAIHDVQIGEGTITFRMEKSSAGSGTSKTPAAVSPLAMSRSDLRTA
jgi:hypothetical protein